MFLKLRSCPIDNGSCSDVSTLVSDRGIRALHVGIQIGGGTMFFCCSPLLGLNPNCCNTSVLFLPPFLTGSAVGEQTTSATWLPPLLKFNLLPNAKTPAFLTSAAFYYIWVKLIWALLNAQHQRAWSFSCSRERHRCGVSHVAACCNGFQLGTRTFAPTSCVKMVIVRTEVTSVYVPVDLRHIQTQRGFLGNEQGTTDTVCLNGNGSL